MRIIRTPMKPDRPTGNTYVLEPSEAGFPVRALYLENDSVPSGLPDYVAVRIVLDDSGALSRFAQFLKEHVKQVDDDEVKVTIGQIWNAWAEAHGANGDIGDRGNQSAGRRRTVQRQVQRGRADAGTSGRQGADVLVRLPLYGCGVPKAWDGWEGRDVNT
ncbi:MAG: hypothetical protein F4Y49_15190 [Dehalococcoidia bacterium]|nr:hypothetical protein [Dehalococcoidia bacterium]MYK61968.1 hypothetical protein [Chloroflexota bacterium]